MRCGRCVNVFLAGRCAHHKRDSGFGHDDADQLTSCRSELQDACRSFLECGSTWVSCGKFEQAFSHVRRGYVNAAPRLRMRLNHVRWKQMALQPTMTRENRTCLKMSTNRWNGMPDCLSEDRRCGTENMRISYHFKFGRKKTADKQRRRTCRIEILTLEAHEKKKQIGNSRTEATSKIG